MPNQTDWHCIRGIEREIETTDAEQNDTWIQRKDSHPQRTDLLKCKTCHRSSFESKVRICNFCNNVFCPCYPVGLNCYGSCSLLLAKGCSACKCCLLPVCTALSAVVKLWVLKRHSWPRAESWSSFFYILSSWQSAYWEFLLIISVLLVASPEGTNIVLLFFNSQLNKELEQIWI